jgi:hypothetical protein
LLQCSTRKILQIGCGVAFRHTGQGDKIELVNAFRARLDSISLLLNERPQDLNVSIGSDSFTHLCANLLRNRLDLHSVPKSMFVVE